MFNPKFTYTNKLISNLGKVRELIGGLNQRSFSSTILYKLEKEALAVSAYSSTSIEGNPLPLTEVRSLLKLSPKNIRDTQKEVLNYNNALMNLNKVIDSKENLLLSNDLIKNTQKLVTQDLIDKSNAGRYRNVPVFVNNPTLKETVYWPPDSNDVPSLMDNLIDYINKNQEIDYLVLAGIFHKQFVIIHPFVDGNGRTARLITKTLLAKMGLNTFNLFSFENYYNLNVTKYFNNVGVLGNYYDNYNLFDFTSWLEYFTDGIIDELNRVIKLLPKEVQQLAMVMEHHKIILDYINKFGFIRDSDYLKLTNRSKASRTLDFKRLLDLDLIERHGSARGTYYT